MSIVTWNDYGVSLEVKTKRYSPTAALVFINVGENQHISLFCSEAEKLGNELLAAAAKLKEQEAA